MPPSGIDHAVGVGLGGGKDAAANVPPITDSALKRSLSFAYAYGEPSMNLPSLSFAYAYVATRADALCHG